MISLKTLFWLSDSESPPVPPQSEALALNTEYSGIFHVRSTHYPNQLADLQVRVTIPFIV